MGKRKTIVISSSDDADDTASPSPRPSSRGPSNPNPKSKRSIARPNANRTNPRGPKRPRLSASSRSRLTTDYDAVDELRFFCEDFEEGFSGFKVPPGFGKERKELWVDKYEPHSFQELAVHHKKVEEVKMWFEERLRMRPVKEAFHSHVLVVTGPAGVGKSATIKVIASHLGATLREWRAPTPTIWQEHVHNSNSGTLYTSKLDEFEHFVERTRKFGLLPASFAGDAKAAAILLIDDLPVVNGNVAYKRLKSCLHHLVQSAHIPTAILVTDYGKSDMIDSPAHSFEKIQLSLQSAGACKVSFNPITVNSIKKTLSRISRQEQCYPSAEQIDLIANASGGDIRHAITSFQFFCLKPDQALSSSLSNHSPGCMEGKCDGSNSLDDIVSLPFGRDGTLSLFHALGKFLHNKRGTEGALLLDQNAFLLRERFMRLPLKMEAPEKVLCQAHVQARPVADFLHENVLDFMSDEAIEDAYAVTSYLTDADLLLANLFRNNARNSKVENLIQTISASVAVRGVLYGNSNPLSSRWHAIRRPKLWEVEQSSLHNRYEFVRQKSAMDGNLVSADVIATATEFTPALKWLGYRACGNSETLGNDREDENADEMSLDDQTGDISEDEIEDW